MKEELNDLRKQYEVRFKGGEKRLILIDSSQNYILKISMIFVFTMIRLIELGILKERIKSNENESTLQSLIAKIDDQNELIHEQQAALDRLKGKSVQIQDFINKTGNHGNMPM